MPPFVLYRFTPKSSGIPVLELEGEADVTTATVEDLASRVARMNGEDKVRNLMHACGYYYHLRMWTDVVNLYAVNTMVTLKSSETYNDVTGQAGAR